MILASCSLDGCTGHQAAWELLEQVYRQQTGENMPEILRESRGKPKFASGKWYFSLSHTRCHAFCVLAEAPVGVDAEELDRTIDLRLADKILSPGERRQYDCAPDKRLALLRFWVLKEAAAKATGEGLRGYPCHTDFSLDDPRVQILSDCLVAVCGGTNSEL